MADATIMYYANDVPTKHNPVARYNSDEPKRDPKLLLFQYPGGKAGASKVENISPEEKDCIMLYVLMNMDEVVDFMSQFHDEMWSGRNGPTPTQWYTLLKEGAPPLNKSWFYEKGADPNVEMTDELRCVSQGFNRRVHTHEKYDVNGYRFHTEFHQKNRPNAKTINTGVYTRGADDLDYYGRLQKVYELTFNNANIELKLFVFKCHWFDPHGGMRSTPSIGLVEVRPTTTYSGSDVYVVAHQTKQVYYLSYPCQNEELMGWEVVFQEEQFGDLQIDIGLQELHNDVQMRGETVVDLKDIAMLTKRNANKDNIVETQPEPNADHEYSYDTDFDSEAENPMPRDESGDECNYRVATEHKERADVILRNMCRKLTRQWYNQRITCIGHFYAERAGRSSGGKLVDGSVDTHEGGDAGSERASPALRCTTARPKRARKNTARSKLHPEVEDPMTEPVDEVAMIRVAAAWTSAALGVSSSRNFTQIKATLLPAATPPPRGLHATQLEEAYELAYEEYLEKIKEHDLVRDAYAQWTSNQMASFTRFMMTGVREEPLPEPPHPGPTPVPVQKEFYCMYKRQRIGRIRERHSLHHAAILLVLLPNLAWFCFRWLSSWFYPPSTVEVFQPRFTQAELDEYSGPPGGAPP
ncbi:hypothetical protein QYE76_059263 [Lolium multiflorum]|uniref:DUF4216 domain-containing protein n=1 Tax=Lolium multiflorum TaxID=4521 RepID=A0AAD8QGG9_LOLMU|nr:hypothetical protein QYE76_059263 [Lolium multiflorum]